MKAFISYSHRDEAVVERLHTHLAMLKREGALSAWYDREILGGGDLDDDIAENLAASDLFIAVVSPDFLSSDYCYEREMARAIERHEKGDIRVLPIIAEPCDWHSSPLARFKALPKDGKPISEWENKNNAFVDIIGEIRRIHEADTPSVPVGNSSEETSQPKSAKGYRIQRDFDAIDKADFKRECYKSIRSYLVNSARELDQVEGVRARVEDLGPTSLTATIVNRFKEGTSAHITIHSASDTYAMGDIFFSHQLNAPSNTANGGFLIESDEYELFLSPQLFSFSEMPERVTAKEAAEYLWNDLLERAGIRHE